MKFDDVDFIIGAVVLSVPFLYEWWGTSTFNAKIYSLGPVVFSFKEPWTKNLFPSGNIQKTPSGRFKVIKLNHILFQYKNPSFFKSRRSFPLKGTILIRGNTATIYARAPLAMSSFLAICVIGVSILGIRIVKTHSFSNGIAILLGGWLIAYVIAYLNLVYEKKRLLMVLEEIKS